VIRPGLLIVLSVLFPAFCLGASVPQLGTDTIETANGPLVITFIGHGSLMFTFGGKTLHIDPFSELTDYSKLTKADVILITHEHKDHFDLTALEAVRKETTLVVLPEICAVKYQEGILMRNGDVKTVQGFRVEAVPAYNVLHKRNTGVPYHIKGLGNGYVIDFGDKRVYVAGDTELIPEMRELKDIDIAFLPMNLPYTMTIEMAADAAKVIQPKIVYPYHYGDSNTAELVEMLKGRTDIEVRIRQMK
jgi:L-ascorbate metabolism protein UlaG (beta-lactamase superfamily)